MTNKDAAIGSNKASNSVSTLTKVGINELDRIFSGDIEFIFGSNKAGDLPPETLPEYAFLGKSNVGKSSLINAFTNRKSLARVSHTPGRTKQINFFKVRDLFQIVDVPGYGYAKVSKSEHKEWNRLIYNYLSKRRALACVFLLIDSRHGIKENDIAVMDLLSSLDIYYWIIYTKCDKISKADKSPLEEQARKVSLLPDPIIILFASSKEKGGLTEFKEAFCQLYSS